MRAAFLQQATWCRQLGSPFTGLVCEIAGRRLDRSTETGRRILEWQGQADPLWDVVPLRLTGALHGLVRRGRLPELARLFPPAPLPDEATLWPSVAAALADADREILPWLDHPPQTNEVGRSALFMAGLLVVASRTRLPVALYEIGASAGLNLALDGYAYDLGGLRAGAVDSPLLLAPDWQGPPPPRAELHIARRLGADLRPLEVGRAEDRERLLAYVWPDQAERLERMQAAIALAGEDPPAVEHADAADWVERRIDPEPGAGCARVLCHSIAFQYFSECTKERITRHVERVGARATPGAPFAWLQFEIHPALGPSPAPRLQTWPSGAVETLATGNAHGTRIKWLAGGESRA
jgi:hypothetical protein